MTQSGKTLALMASTTLLCSSVMAVVADPAEQQPESDNPYQTIIDRNVFDLKAPPPPPDPNKGSEEKGPSKFTLTGITSIFGAKRALLKTQVPAKAGQPATDQWFMIAEGKEEGDIKVLEIDEKAGSVKMRNAGVEVTLTFDKDGNKPPASSAPLPNPAPGGPGGGPSAIPSPTGPGGTSPGLRPLPTRTLRTPGGTGAPVPPAGGASVQPMGSDAAGNLVAGAQPGQVGTVAVPGGAGSQQLTPEWPPRQNLTPVEERILIEAQREIHRNDPNIPPLPPTELTPQQPVQQQRPQ